ncbi:hypothetical protein AS9A_2727 [Hoyosella subflava DQS3-9A1]|uniref:Uncharacterized protein n=1 Tax=Hoyosella subflava (strain DSM 45089 / JCM 17490 / NBRC 109087 / DQS3-9A1) TaxID=443218 RepID=F6EI67_HOYSD|nr:hypothetical protein AS9A_2727 [Hoyosella subflava DQS3-9A1]
MSVRVTEISSTRVTGAAVAKLAANNVTSETTNTIERTVADREKAVALDHQVTWTSLINSL